MEQSSRAWGPGGRGIPQEAGVSRGLAHRSRTGGASANAPAGFVDLDAMRANLEDYLRQKGIHPRKLFRCLAPEHEDRHPSMSFNPKAQKVHCFACGATFDLFDLIGFDYNISKFPGQLEKAQSLFPPGNTPGKTRGKAGELAVEKTESLTSNPPGNTPGNTRGEAGDLAVCCAGVVKGGAALTADGTWGEKRVIASKPRGSAVSAAALVLDDANEFSVVRSAPHGADALVDRTADLDKLRAAADGQFDYFEARGIPAELCERYGLFQSGGRAVMPVFDDAGRCLGWCARAMAEGVEPRYKNSSGTLPLWCGVPPQASRGSRAGKDGADNLESTGRWQAWDGACSATADAASEVRAFTPNVTSGVGPDAPTLYTNARPGGDFPPQRGLGQSPICATALAPGANSTVYITEGVLDALSLIAAGRRAVALCGSQNTRKLFALLDGGFTARFIVCGDGDNAGRKMNAALLEGFAARGLVCSTLELPDGADPNALWRQDSAALMQLLESAETQLLDLPRGPDTEYDESSALGALDDFFAQAARRAGDTGLATGLAGLDAALGGGLRPGLIVLGAPSSLGKTSLVLQMADQLAQDGSDVLFFSLEMSRYELMAKSLSRISAELDDHGLRRALTSRDLLCGVPCSDLEQQLLLRRARARYEDFCGRVFLREGLADIGPLEIRQAVAEHIARRGRKPIVFVDYLQILAPCDLRATDKQNTDRAVVELKRISRDFDVPVLAISSFNREGYRVAASMESFKESGAVEYSSDVLLALQLEGVGEPGFDANARKLRDPRRLELVLLKNRSGVPYAKLKLEYSARFGCFAEKEK